MSITQAVSRREAIAKAIYERLLSRYQTERPPTAYIYGDDDLTAVGVDGEVDLLDLADAVIAVIAPRPTNSREASGDEWQCRNDT